MKTDITQTTTTDMDSSVDNYSVASQETDSGQSQKEFRYNNANWTKQLGYFKVTPEINRAITALATYTAGLGYTAELSRQKAILENITGWGEDTFTSILMNMIKVKKFGGDSYAEIVKNDKGDLANLNVLNTGRMTIVTDDKNQIKEYEYASNNKDSKPQIFQPNEIFHLCNDRIADECHGTSVMEFIEWIILARNEAMRDWKRISHRSTVRIMFVPEDDPTRLANLKTDYSTAINNGELIIVPAKPGEAQFQDLVLPPAASFLEWIRYLENFFYQAIGVSRVIANPDGLTESGGKVGFLTFEPVYTNEQRQLEQDVWNQLAIKIKFNRPPSLGGDLGRDEAKDGQGLGFQPNDTEAGAGK
jgi:hypothetical protein